jgi:hypothetical protein
LAAESVAESAAESAANGGAVKLVIMLAVFCGAAICILALFGVVKFDGAQ